MSTPSKLDPAVRRSDGRGSEPPSVAKEVEGALWVGGFAAAGVLRAIELGAVVLIGLLVCPPLFILVVVVVVPLVAIALLLVLAAAVVSAPYVLVRHLRGHRGGHVALFAQRARHAAHALLELAPHRVASGVQRAGHGR
jgi:hypothetical protein